MIIALVTHHEETHTIEYEHAAFGREQPGCDPPPQKPPPGTVYDAMYKKYVSKAVYKAAQKARANGEYDKAEHYILVGIPSVPQVRLLPTLSLSCH